MFLFNSTELDPNFEESDKIPDSFCDISSIPNTSVVDLQKSPWGSNVNNENNSFFTPTQLPEQDFCNIYNENIKLKKKIKDLEDSLKNCNLKNKCQDPDSLSFTQSTNWRLSQKPSFITNSPKESNLIRNLEKDFNSLGLDNDKIKRNRAFSNTKHPHKFLKIAIISSIGTLKF